MLARSLAVCRHDFRVLRSDLAPFFVMIAMPVGMMAFIKTAFKGALVSAGYEGATGAEHAVPGMVVMFAMFLIGFTGFAFFREHQWGTWERLRASPARPLEIMIGKVIPSLAIVAVQMGALFGIGAAVFGFRVNGSVLALVAVAVTFALFLVALGVAAVSVCRTSQQVNTLTNLGAMIMAGLGGALAPISVLPAWAQPLAPGSPSYWAMRGFRSVVLDGGGLGSVLLPITVLAVFTVGATAVAMLRFRFEETKVSYA